MATDENQQSQPSSNKFPNKESTVHLKCPHSSISCDGTQKHPLRNSQKDILNLQDTCLSSSSWYLSHTSSHSFILQWSLLICLMIWLIWIACLINLKPLIPVLWRLSYLLLLGLLYFWLLQLSLYSHLNSEDWTIMLIQTQLIPHILLMLLRPPLESLLLVVCLFIITWRSHLLKCTCWALVVWAHLLSPKHVLYQISLK